MADFNSRYTGAEIEAAVARSANIISYKQVWAGAPTDAGVYLSTLPINPDTGDRTGVYDIICSRVATPVETATEYSYASRLTISNEGGGAVGTTHTIFETTNARAQGVIYFGNIDQRFKAVETKHTYSDDNIDILQLYIHGIYRLQSAS